MKKAILLVIAAVSLCLSLVPGTAEAQTAPTVSKTSVDIKFPTQMDFSITATGNSNISDVRLRYTVQQESFAEVTSEVAVPVTSAKTVSTHWVMDMRQTGGFPPGTTVHYWWVVRDASGGRVETLPTAVDFNDTRYKWQKKSEGLVDLYWYSGSNTFANELMAAAQDGLTKLAGNTGARLKKRVSLYIYASSTDLKGALIFPYEWTGGLTLANFSTIVLGIAPSDLAWGKRAIAHELTHMVVHQVTSNPYSDLPRWLDEGLAVYNEGPLDASMGTALQRAVGSSGLISVQSLASPFSTDAQVANLSYAESFSIVEYLVTAQGQAKMLELLNVFSKGSRYDDALQSVYGFDVAGLNSRWHDYVYKLFNKTTRPAVSLPVAGGA
jgi:hypothetical protein